MKIGIRAGILLAILTFLCGGLYTAVISLTAQVVFPEQANGSIIRKNGVAYGSRMIAQPYTGVEYLWGRVMNLDTSTFQDEEGKPLLYAVPSNLSPTSDEYKSLITERVNAMREANPEQGDKPIPVDLVTCSGSGLDPGISVAAAEYQVARIAKARGLELEQVNQIIKNCTTGKFLGVFGEETVNVLLVNLTLDGILE